MPPETQEDYWEDASVSLGCSHGWGFPFICSAALPLQAEEAHPPSKNAADGHRGVFPQTESCAVPYIVDFCSSSSSRRLRSFPPPISFCVTLSIKEGGRFVLKEVHARPWPQSCFRAERENGRLRLCLLESEDLDECNEVCTDLDKSAPQLLNAEVQDVSDAASDKDEHLLCDCSHELSEYTKTTAGLTLKTGHGDANAVDVSEIYVENLNIREGDANAVDISEMYDENLNIRQGDANAGDVCKICDDIPCIKIDDTIADDVPDMYGIVIGARHDYPNADNVHETNEDVCRIYSASFSDVSRHGAGVSGLSSSNHESMRSLNSRIVSATDVGMDSVPDIPYVCMDSIAESPSSETVSQILEASTPVWTTSDASLLIRSCHGSFAKLSPTVGLTVS